MSDTVDALIERHASIARAQFLEIDAVTSLYFERCAEDEKAGRNPAVQGEFVHVEVAFVLSITEYAATRMIALGCDLRLRLHRVSAAFASGEIDLGKATACSDALANVSDDALDLIEQLLLDGAGKCSSSRLKARARSLIARHDPEGARARRRRAQEDRDVRISAGVDGMSTLDGVLPAVGAQIVAAKLATMSRQVCARDPRTLAQRRADALVALSEGRSTSPVRAALTVGGMWSRHQPRPKRRFWWASTFPRCSDLMICRLFCTATVLSTPSWRGKSRPMVCGGKC